MTLARVWRRQLLGASGAALIVPSAMLAASVLLALGGGFRSLGVLGQVFAGPPAPAAGALPGGHRASDSGAAGGVASALPVIPVAGAGSTPGRAGHTVVGAAGRGDGAVAMTLPAPTGGALGSSSGPVSVVTRGPAGGAAPQPAPVSAAPSHPVAPTLPPPPPQPPSSPRPTVVDQVVKVVTPVTSQLPAPAGPAATAALQSAGAAADSLLPPPGSSLP